MTNTQPPSPGLMSAVASMKQPLTFFTKNLVRYPEIFQSGLLGFSAFVIHHPPYIRHVLSDHARNYVKFEKYRYLRLIGGNGLVTNEGESWRHQRRLIQPAFSQAALDRAIAVMWQETDAVVCRLESRRETVLDVSETLGELTIAIVARCLFSSDVAEHVAEIRRELDLAQQLGNVLLRIPLPLYGAVPYLPVFRRITKAATRLRSMVTGLIARRRACTERPADLLEALMAAAEDQSQGGMTEDQLVDEVLTLLLAGHETTLLALSWAFHLIAHHPVAFERLRHEAVTIDASQAGGHGALNQLVWARAVAREAMRLYPPAYLIGRTALDDDVLGEYEVPAGTNVLINIYGLHRHPAYWRDPDAFQPERMLDNFSSDPARFLFLPFGAGPRSCIGARFTMCEMQIILSAFARAFTLTPLDARPLYPSPQITLKTGRPVQLRIEHHAAGRGQEASARPVRPIPA